MRAKEWNHPQIPPHGSKFSLDLSLKPGHDFDQRIVDGGSAREGDGFLSMNKYRKRGSYLIGDRPPFEALTKILVIQRLERNSKKPVLGTYKEELDGLKTNNFFSLTKLARLF